MALWVVKTMALKPLRSRIWALLWGISDSPTALLLAVDFHFWNRFIPCRRCMLLLIWVTWRRGRRSQCCRGRRGRCRRPRVDPGGWTWPRRGRSPGAPLARIGPLSLPLMVLDGHYVIVQQLSDNVIDILQRPWIRFVSFSLWRCVPHTDLEASCCPRNCEKKSHPLRARSTRSEVQISP